MDFLRRLRFLVPSCRFTGNRGVLKFVSLAGVLGLLCVSASAQTTSQCVPSASPTGVASTGLAEKIGDIVLACTGGTTGNTVIAQLFIALNTNVTNSLDASGNPKFITVTSSGAAVTATPAVLTSATTLKFATITYTVPTPNSIPVFITIAGIRAAVASIQNGVSPSVVTASLVAIGFTLPSTSFNVAIGGTALTSSALNNGIACAGSPVPATQDFPGFINARTTSSAVRITESIATAFTTKTSDTTNGTRIVVRLSGYGTGIRLFVPDAVVGNSGSIPTSGGEFSTTIAGGTYTPNANQLLLSRVDGADQTGAGGTLATSLPVGGASFTAMKELTVTAGAAYAVYEVLDSSPFVNEAVQVPVFIANAGNNCSASLQTVLTASLAPVSNVSIATAADPIPRYISAGLGSDCQQIGDCTAGYFPVLSISNAPVSFSGASQGPLQTTLIPMLNNGGTQLNLSISIAYQSGSGWLTATPGSSSAGLSLSVAANPATLQPGVYTATVNLDGGNAGTASIPVTFTVGPVGVTIQGIVNAASYQVGPIAPGSYVALFGLNLAGNTVGVTFNGLAANLIYKSAGQINLIVPSSLSGQTNATVLVTVDGTKVSNSFVVQLAANTPGIFTPGILNVDNSVNAVGNPASRGSIVQIYFTGLAVPVLANSVTVNMGTQQGLVPLFAGPQPTLPALDQVNVTIPSALAFTGNSTTVAVCVSLLPATTPICSNSVNLYVQ